MKRPFAYKIPTRQTKAYGYFRAKISIFNSFFNPKKHEKFKLEKENYA